VLRRRSLGGGLSRDTSQVIEFAERFYAALALIWNTNSSSAMPAKTNLTLYARSQTLRKANYLLWYDEFELKLGDSLIGKIDYGLANSTGGVIVLSPAFLSKKWANATIHLERMYRPAPMETLLGLTTGQKITTMAIIHKPHS
jgi:hypothetical protein